MARTMKLIASLLVLLAVAGVLFVGSTDSSSADDDATNGDIIYIDSESVEHVIGTWAVTGTTDMAVEFTDNGTHDITDLKDLTPAVASGVTSITVKGYYGDLSDTTVFKTTYGLGSAIYTYLNGRALYRDTGGDTENGTWAVENNTVTITPNTGYETSNPNLYENFATVSATVTLAEVNGFTVDITSNLATVLLTDTPIHYLSGTGDIFATSDASGTAIGTWTVSGNTITLSASTGYEDQEPLSYSKLYAQTNDAITRVVIKGFTAAHSVGTQFPNATQIVFLGNKIVNSSNKTVGNWGLDGSVLTIETVQEKQSNVWVDTYYSGNDLTFVGMDGTTKDEVYSISISRFTGDLSSFFAEFGHVINSRIIYTDKLSDGSWSYNYGTNTLTISASSTTFNKSTPSYNTTDNLAPWSRYDCICNNMNTVEIEGYVTLGNYSFYGCTALKTVRSDSITYLTNRYAFRIGPDAPNTTYVVNMGAIETIYMPNLETLGNPSDSWYAPFYCSSTYPSYNNLKTVYCPKVSNIGSCVFAYNTLLETVTLGTATTLSINNQAFDGCTSLTTIDTSHAVYVYNYAFRNCTSLENVNLTNVKEVGSYAFYGCSKLASVNNSGNTVLTTVGSYAFDGDLVLGAITLPDTLKSLGSYAFHNCTKLGNVTISDKITAIPSYAFTNCISMTIVDLPDSVTLVNSYAFYGCSGITSLTLSDNITKIDTSAFSGCLKISTLTLPSKLVTLSNNAFYGCTGLTCVISIPETVETIGNYAFSKSTGITGVDFGDPTKAALTSIGVYAFSDSSSKSLNLGGTISIPNNVTTIGTGAFYGCQMIEKLVLGTGLLEIGSYAFIDCKGIEAINIPDSVTTIKNQAFQGCTGATELTIGSGSCLTTLQYQAFYNCNKAVGEVYIPGTVATIGSNAFYNCCELTTVTLNSGLNRIENSAFIYCSKIESCSIPDTVTYIGYNAFYNCALMAGTLSFSDNLTEIGYQAFMYCANITGDLKIGEKVNQIGYQAFYGCTGITGVDFTSCKSLTSIGYRAFYNCQNMVGDIILPDTVEEVGYGAFHNCLEVTGLDIGSKVAFTGDYNSYPVFMYCNNLTYIKVSSDNKNLKSVDDSALLDIGEQTIYLYACKSATKEFTVSETVQTIKKYAFYGAVNLEKLTFATKASFSIEEHAFDGCTGITGTLTLPDSLYSLGAYAFQYCTSITAVVIDGVPSVFGTQAFQYCTGIRSLTAPISTPFLSKFNGCTNIRYFTFTGTTGDNTYYSENNYYTPWTYYNSGLTQNNAELKFASTVTEIPRNMFHTAYRVSTVDMSESTLLKTIGQGAFYNCYNVTELTISNSVTNLGLNAFYNCTNVTTLTLPITLKLSIINSDVATIPKATKITSITFTSGTTGVSVDYLDENTSSTDEQTSISEAIWYYDTSYYVYFQEGVKTVGDNMHLRAQGTVTMPSTMQSIGVYAFQNSTLNPLSLNEGLITIKDGAFANCGQLQSVTIPSTVTTLGVDPFNGCIMLTKVTVPITLNVSGIFSNCEKISAFEFNKGSNGRGVDYTEQSAELTPWRICVSPSFTVVLDEGIVSIGAYMFDGCSGSTAGVIHGLSGEMKFPSTVTDIGAYAYRGCIGLTSVVLTSAIKTIGEHAFEGCTGFDELTISSKITLGASAFKGCSGIETLTIPVWFNATVNGTYPVFEGCTGLTKVEFTGSGAGVDYNATEGDNLCYLYTPWYYSSGNSIELVLSSKITEIGDYTFMGCSGLYYDGVLTFGNGLDTIGTHAFDGCSSIESVSITTDAVSAAKSSFKGCTGLKTLAVDAGFNTVGYEDCPIFEGCTGLQSVELTGTGASIDYSGDIGDLYYGYTPWYCSKDMAFTLTLSDDLTSIGTYTFMDCSKMKNFTTPASLVRVAEHAFDGCSSMVCNITLDNDFYEVGNYAFRNCASMASLTISVDASSIILGYSAFEGCSGISSLLVPVGISDSISTDKDLFKGCTGLTSLVVTGTGAGNDYTDVYDCTPWYLSSANGKTILVTISDDLTSIGDCMFKGCTGINTKMEFSQKLTYIGDEAFRGCTKMTGISFNGQVTDIGEYAFANTGISGAFVLPTSVDFLGEFAFSGCTQITELTISQMPTTVGDGVFSGCTGMKTLHFPIEENAASGDTPMFYGCNKITKVEFTGTGNGFNYSSTDDGSSWYQDTPWYYSRGNSITMELPDALSIGEYMFAGCTNLYGVSGTVTIPSTIKSIGAHAFDGCSKFSKLVIADTASVPSDLNYIYEYAFYGCNAIRTGIELPASLLSVGDYAFAGCSTSTSLKIAEGPHTIGAHAFDGCMSMGGTLSLPTTMRTVGEFAFNGCSSFTKLLIPTNQVTIGQGAFTGCSKLNSIVIPAELNTVGSNANPLFKGCAGITNVELTGTLDGAEYSTDDSSDGDNYYQYTPWYYSKLNKITLVLSDNLRSVKAYTFMGCTGIYGTVSLPSDLVSLGVHAFDGCTGIQSLKFRGSILSTIEEYAFQNCSALSGTLELPSSVTYINQYAFAGCGNLTSISLPDVLVNIGAHAFDGCSKITNSLKIPNTVNSIGVYAFNNCQNITGLEIVNSSLSLGAGAFTNCVRLSSLIVPSSMNMVVSNSEPLFLGCIGLTYVEFTGSSDCCSYTPEDAASDYKNSRYTCTPWYYSKANTITLKFSDSIGSIGDYLFMGCTGLSGDVAFPSALKTVGVHAFDGCEKITGTPVLADIVTDVGEFAFSGCTGFSGLVLSNANVNLGKGAFAGCTGIRSLTLPITMNPVGDYEYPIFKNCSGIKEFIFTSTGEGHVYTESEGDSCYTCTPWYYSRNQVLTVTFPDGLNTIGDYMFMGCTGLSSRVTIPDSVNSIGDHAFDGCSKIESLVFGRSLNSIGAYAFRGLEMLSGSLVVPSGIMTLGTGAFMGCTKVTSLTITTLPSTLGAKAFYGCTAIKSLSLPLNFNAALASAPYNEPIFGGVTGLTTLTFTGEGEGYGYSDVLGSSYYQNTPWYLSRTNQLTVTFPDGVTAFGTNMFRDSGFNGTLTVSSNVATIGAHAFDGCNRITGLVIDSAVLGTIGDYAFNGCNSLAGTATIPSSVYTIGSYAFAGCTTLGGLELNEGLETVGSYAFSGCANIVVSLVVPSTVSKVGEYAFNGCTSVDSVTITKTAEFGRATFNGCSGIKSISMPISIDTVVDAENPLFAGCSAITSITLTGPDGGFDYTDDSTGSWYQSTPWYISRSSNVTLVLEDSIVSIGDYTFKDATCISGSVKMPSSLRSIGDYAFDGCSKITGTITLGPSVSSVGVHAFAGCTGFDTLVIENDNANILSAGSFNGCSTLRVLTIPGNRNTVASPTDPAFGGCTSIRNITITGTGAGWDYSESDSSDSYYLCTPWKLSLQNVALTINEGLTSIGNNMFNGSNLAGNLVLPDSLTQVGEASFKDCPNITGPMVLSDKVVVVGKSAFEGCRNITSLTIGSASMVMAASSFKDCVGIKALVIPVSVNTVCDDDEPAFEGCTNLSSITLNGITAACNYVDYRGDGKYYKNTPWYLATSDMKLVIDDEVQYIGDFMFCDSIFLSGTVALPSGIVSIGNNAFSGCVKISGALTLPATVTYLGREAFSGCTLITSVTFNGTPVNFGQAVFKGCSGIQSLKMPISMDAVGNESNPTFEGCTGLVSVTFSAGIGVDYTLEDGTRPYSLTPWYMSRLGSVKIQIEDGVTYIGQYTFYKCGSSSDEKGLAGTITVPSSVTSIGKGAFQQCIGITSFNGSDVSDVGEAVFKECTSLSTVSLPSLESVSSEMFRECTSLNTVTLSSGCSSIGRYAFCSTTSLKNVNNTTTDYLVNLPGVTYVGDYAFAYSGIVNINIGTEGVAYQTFGDYVFYECPNLVTVKIYGIVDSLATNTFRSSNTPSSFRSPIKRIEAKEVKAYSALLADNFDKLTYLDISSATNIGNGEIDGIFMNCTSLQTVKLYKDSSDDATTFRLPKEAFRGCVSLTSIDLDNALLLNGYEFYGCEKLNTVTLSKAGSISEYAFYGCTQLQSVSAPIAISIGDYAFANTGLQSINAADLANVTTLGDSVFEYSTLTSLVMPSASSVGTYTFRGCAKLVSVTMDSLNTVRSNMFYNCTSLRSVSFAVAESLESLAFYNCTSLTTVDFPKVAKVGSTGTADVIENDYRSYSVFYNCTNLTTVSMPSDGLEIGAFAFYGCTSLVRFNSTTAIQLTDVGTIGAYAFANSGVKDVTVGRDVSGLTVIGDYAFYNCNSLQNFTSPSLTSLPEHLFNNSDVNSKSLASMLVSISVPKVTAFNANLHNSQNLRDVNAPLATSFATYAFYGCTQLQNVTLMDDASNGVTVTLSAHMFEGCTSLKSISLTNAVFSGNLYDLSNGAVFMGCTALQSVDMPAATSVSAYAFDGCTALVSANLPAATAVGSYAFYNCSKLSTVNVPVATNVCDYAFSGCSGMTDFNSTTGYNPFINIETIGRYAFEYCPFTSLSLGPRTSSLGDYAFKDNSQMKELVTNNLLEVIPEGAFYGCPLASVHIASSVKTILEHAFDYTGSGMPSVAGFWFNGDVGASLLSAACVYSSDSLVITLHISESSEDNVDRLISRGAFDGAVTTSKSIEYSGSIDIWSGDSVATPTYSRVYAVYGGKIVLPYAETAKANLVYMFASEVDTERLSIFTSDANFEARSVAKSGDTVAVYPLKVGDAYLFRMCVDEDGFTDEITVNTNSYGKDASPMTQTVHYGSKLTIPSFYSALDKLNSVVLVRYDSVTYDLPLDTVSVYVSSYYITVNISPENAMVDVTFVGVSETKVIQMALQSLLLPVPEGAASLETPLEGFEFDAWYTAPSGEGIKANSTTKINGEGMVWYAHFNTIEYSIVLTWEDTTTGDVKLSKTVTAEGPYTLHNNNGALYYTDYTHTSNLLILDANTITGYTFDMYSDHRYNKEILGDYTPGLTSTTFNIDLYMITKQYTISLEFYEWDEETSTVGSLIPETLAFTMSGWGFTSDDLYGTGDVFTGIDFSKIETGMVIPTPIDEVDDDKGYSLSHILANGTEISQRAGRYTVYVENFDDEGKTVLKFYMSEGLMRVVFKIHDDANTDNVNAEGQFVEGDRVRIISITGTYTKIGYSFDYMYVEDKDGNPLCDSEGNILTWKEREYVTITSDMIENSHNCTIIFDVSWVSKVFTVNFSVLPYEGTISSQTLQIGDTLTFETLTGYTGHTLGSWSWVEGSTYETYTGSMVLTKKMVEDYANGSTNMTIYANWDLNSYTLTVDKSVGVKFTDKTVTYGSTFQLWDIGTFTQSFKKFGGWTANGDDRTYLSLDNAVLDDVFARLGDSSGKTITFNVLWDDLEYQVQYNLNNGNGTVPVDYGTYIVGVTEFSMTESKDFTRSGYEFKGWKVSQDSYTIYTNTSGVFDPVLAQNANSDGVVTFYAVWSEMTYFILYDLDGGTSGNSRPRTAAFDSVVTIDNPTKSGNDFAGWSIVMEEGSTAYSEAAYGSGSGDNFVFWDGQDCVATQFKRLCNENRGTVVLQANWTSAEFTISYNYNGGTIKFDTSQKSISLGEKFTMLPYDLSEKEKQGFEFGGWSLDLVNPVNNGDTMTEAMVQDQTKNELVFYALWNPIEYTIYYKYIDGGSYLKLNVSYTEQVNIPLSERVGYNFTGWSVSGSHFATSTAEYSADGSVWYKWSDSSVTAVANYFRNLTFDKNAEVYLDAQWEAIQYRIVYSTNGGTGTAPIDNNIYVIGSSITLSDGSTVGSNGNKSFVGWSLDRDGTATTITSFTESLASKADVTRAVNFYAVWMEGLCTVTINLSGCTPSSVPGGWTLAEDGTYQKMFDYGTSMSDVMAEWKDVTLSKDGKVFNSWTYTSGIVTGDVVAVPTFDTVNMNIVYILGAVIGVVVVLAILSRFRKV